MTSRLIGSGPIRPPVRPSKGQSGVMQAIDHSVVGSMTARPPGIRPSALRVATHGQQLASLGGGVLPLCRGAVGVFYSPSRQGDNKKEKTCRIVDFAFPADHRVKLKEYEKRDKYLDLARELKNLWIMKVTIIQIVIGALSTVT